MAALAAEQLVTMTPDTRVGFIGTGRINLSTAETFKVLFGTREFVATGSPNAETKNIRAFNGITLTFADSREFGLTKIRECEVLISCTTAATNEEECFDYSDLSGPKVFIAHDSGYIFGKTFRDELKSFCDMPEQLINHWENEFPWDKGSKWSGISGQLGEISFTSTRMSAG